MPWLLALAVLVVVVLVALAAAGRVRPEWGRLTYWRARFRGDPEELWGLSAGGYDDAARDAVGRARARLARDGARGAPPRPPREQARDHHTIARVMRHAVAAQPGPPLRRLQALRRAGEHYGEALLLAAADDPAAPEVGLAFMADAAADLVAAAAAGWDAREVFAALQESIATGRRAEREARRAQARGGRPIEEARAFLAAGERHTSDGENTHDHAVVAAQRAQFARLRDAQAGADLPGFGEIRAAIREGGDRLSRDPASGLPRPVLVEERALPAVDAAERGETVLALGATDGEVLRRVWLRADDPRNAEQRGAMRQAVFDALVDCWKAGYRGDELVCPSGRAGRFLGALALLDFDPGMWAVEKTEDIRNEVYAEARAFIEARVAAAAESGDPAVRASALAFRDGEGDASAVEAELRRGLAEMVAAYARERNARAPDSVPDYLEKSLVEDVLAAV